ncbi:hypothetical protein D4R42_00920 [bacterium]|nr:MAG: hypothetical protein D4R42_00920 [bacterium]
MKKTLKKLFWILKARCFLFKSLIWEKYQNKSIIRLLNIEMKRIHNSLLNKQSQPTNSNINAYLACSDLLKIIKQ